MPYRQLLIAIELEIAVLLETVFEEMPTKDRRAFVRRLRRNTRRLVRDQGKITEDSKAGAALAAERLKAHAKALRVLGD